VPLGTPGVLQPFIVVIEIISNIIRPLTLRIRLIANMIAGHLLLTLLGTLRNQRIFVLIMVLIGIILILVLELGVAIIQAYVFTLLSTLYVREINTVKINKLI
jgi:F-type H+-transporting ATPase subunit a